MTADDIARDLMVNGLEDAIEDALRSAAKQGEATIQGKCDELVKRYDNAVAEYKLAFEEPVGEDITDPFNSRAYEAYENEMLALVHLFAAAVGSDEA